MRRAAFFTATLSVLACSEFDGPEEHLQASTTQLVQYSSCSDLEWDLKQLVRYEVFADIDRAVIWARGVVDESAGAEGSGGAAPTDGGRQEGVDYSGTNNQEAGVDEADFVKTDGYHIYTLNGNRLH